MFSIFFISQFFFSHSLETEYYTSSNTHNPCPLDRSWDKTKGICRECYPGFYGTSCLNPCRYPNYGVGCQSFCDCSENICSNIFGCSEDNGTTSSSNLNENHDRSQILANFVIIAALVTGFLIIIICIVAASLLTRRHFSHIILRSEKNISSVLMGPSMNMDRFLSRELERWDSSVPQLSRYEHISVV
ncbi:uncharacterized protein LOC111102346 [Crassostrea virginica]|uniref:Multiple epidermal growth factor-like domains protein 10 n=1 Tax=Crassostrea virginica TaxID=6565 RepID=A0A8B8AHZ4_CRAVI|nr:multiple epidermal growth factor-like domains protein 10 [Crassostrea virginica]